MFSSDVCDIESTFRSLPMEVGSFESGCLIEHLVSSFVLIEIFKNILEAPSHTVGRTTVEAVSLPVGSLRTERLVHLLRERTPQTWGPTSVSDPTTSAKPTRRLNSQLKVC